MAGLTGTDSAPVVLIAGAGTPAGLAFARALVASGARLLLTEVSDARAMSVRDQLASSGGELRAAALDVTNAASWADGFTCAEREFGHVDAMVNAAEFDPGPVAPATAAWSAAMAINLTGVTLGIAASAAVEGLTRVVTVRTRARRGSRGEVQAVARATAAAFTRRIGRTFPAGAVRLEVIEVKPDAADRVAEAFALRWKRR